MLKELRIRNFVLIESLALGFEPGICLLTGETGAGKSILIDAVAAALGGRVSLEVIRAGTDKALVEATFDLGERVPVALAALLEEEGISCAVTGELTLSREISPRGARCRIDGQQVTQAVLRRAGHALVDIISQHEHQALLDPGFHLDLLDQFGGLAALSQLDEFGGLASLRARVAEAHARWHGLVAERQALIEGAQARAQQQDFWRYQLNEIRDAGPFGPDEVDALKTERSRLTHVEQLRFASRQAYDLLYAGENGPSLSDQLGRLIQSLGGLGAMDPTLAEAADALDGAQAVMRDVAVTLRAHVDTLDADPSRLAEVEERLDLLNTLGRKYGPGLDAVLAHADRLVAQLDEVENADARLASLEKALGEAERVLRSDADALTAARKSAGARLEEAVMAQLAELELPHARFGVALTPHRGGSALRATGQEGCEFLAAMNPGEPPRPLAKTASGGEMARVMLALKTVLAGLSDLPTLIFDEVDSGISGRAAQAVAEKLAGLGRHYQILCITHLPTVAAMADLHMHLEKTITGGRTQVSARVLDGPARVRELAMLASGSPAPKALSHAEELLARAADYKASLDKAPHSKAVGGRR